MNKEKNMKYQKTNGTKTELVIDSFRGLDRASALCGGRGSFELRKIPLEAWKEQIRAAMKTL